MEKKPVNQKMWLEEVEEKKNDELNENELKWKKNKRKMKLLMVQVKMKNTIIEYYALK